VVANQNGLFSVVIYFLLTMGYWW